MEPLIVQRLRDAAEDRRVDPDRTADVTLHLIGGRSLTGSVLAVEDGAAYLDLTGVPTVVDLTTIVAAD
ncbi:hypothetical protein CLV92_105206 [Kineococcus xinjiangensis]|uniref:Uncharacterized protein n=1 Tax=Kineococcus xinjiangensis TaxID=512762 RepID=A0A2S6IPC1_9ACTN|nr:hypothetical protein [Kineococcus xinjiangensis]PPK96104.1 hypothetical protein CLV92_105206 [Kineococcus xinjiangensis]